MENESPGTGTSGLEGAVEEEDGWLRSKLSMGALYGVEGANDGPGATYGRRVDAGRAGTGDTWARGGSPQGPGRGIEGAEDEWKVCAVGCALGGGTISSSLTLAPRAFISSLFFPTWGNDPCILRSSSPTRAFIFSTLPKKFVSSSVIFSKFCCSRFTSASATR